MSKEETFQMILPSLNGETNYSSHWSLPQKVFIGRKTHPWTSSLPEVANL